MTVQFLRPRNPSSTPWFDRPATSSLRALTRFISTRTSPLTTKPYSAPRRATWAAYALEISVFVGMHPVFTHEPPNLWRSIIATAMPAAANRAAKGGPAWPVPMMMASKCRVIGRSLRQLFAGLLLHHVLGIPLRPVRIALPGALLVLAMCGLRTPQRTRQIRRGCECCLSRVDPAGQSRRDLLPQPAIGVLVVARA